MVANSALHVSDYFPSMKHRLSAALPLDEFSVRQPGLSESLPFSDHLAEALPWVLQAFTIRRWLWPTSEMRWATVDDAGRAFQNVPGIAASSVSRS